MACPPARAETSPAGTSQAQTPESDQSPNSAYSDRSGHIHGEKSHILVTPFSVPNLRVRTIRAEGLYASQVADSRGILLLWCPFGEST